MTPTTIFRILPSTGVPIYRQLMDQVRVMATNGRLKPGDFLPSVRQMAEDLSVNPMTVSKAWSLLEHEGAVELVRGQGMRLRPASQAPEADIEARLTRLDPLLEQVVAQAHQQGLPSEPVIARLSTRFQEQRHD